MSFHINIGSIPANDMRYDTAGDWIGVASSLRVTVAEQSDARYEALVAIHELVEAVLCLNVGVTAEMVDEFDFNFTGTGEPGDHSDSPYKRQHAVAEIVERIVALELGVDFDKYLREVAERSYGRVAIEHNTIQHLIQEGERDETT